MQPSGPQGIIHTVAKAFENVVFIQCTENKCLLYGSVCHFLPSAVRNKKGTVHCKVLTCVKCHYNSGSRLIFSFLCCLSKGESGLGKSTLINSLFLTDLYPERIIPGAAGETSTAISVNQETAVWRKKKKKKSFFCFISNRKDWTNCPDRSINGGDWGAGGEASPHCGGHARIRRCHQQPRLVGTVISP